MTLHYHALSGYIMYSLVNVSAGQTISGNVRCMSEFGQVPDVRPPLDYILVLTRY
jgi:hypothetical protein